MGYDDNVGTWVRYAGTTGLREYRSVGTREYRFKQSREIFCFGMLVQNTE
jgi:hypothetical protein